MKLNKFLTLALIVGLGAPAFGGPVGVSRTPVTSQKTEVIAELASAKGDAEQLARAAFKGAVAARYRMKAVEIDNLIERLKSGEQVSPEEIDHAMQR